MVWDNLCGEGFGCLVVSQNPVPLRHGSGQVTAPSFCGENGGKEVNSPFSGLQALDYSNLIFRSGRMHASIACL